MKPRLAAVLAMAALAGCGSSDSATPVPEPADASSAWPASELAPEPGFDPDDPALQTIPDDDEHRKALIREAGDRRDFKVPSGVVAGLQDGPLVRAVVTRSFNDLAGDEAAERRLNAGQRAVYAMYLADFEILNGGFAQFWINVSPAIANDIADLSERVGSTEFSAIFRDGQALWPGGRIPSDFARREQLIATLDGEKLGELDSRYAATQYKRSTALGTVLARYIRANTKAFVAD